MEVFKLFGKIQVDAGDANKKIDGVTKTAQQAEGKMNNAFGSIGKAVKGAFTVGAVVAFEKQVISTYKEYDDQMRKVQAVTNATGKEYQSLRDRAEELGRSTRFSATEAGEGMEALGRAGWDTDQILAGIGETLSFATANSIGLGEASGIVADGLSQFGMSAEETGKFTDILSMTARESNTDILLLGDTLKYVGPVAGSLGYELEDVSIAMGLMANQGIKGGQAGTALRNIMVRMAKPTKESGAAMDALGLSLTDANGEMKPFNEIMRDMRVAFAELTPEQQAQYAAMLAGQQGMSGLLAIVNASEEEFDAMSEAMKNSTGVTQEMAEIMDGGLGGAIEGVKSAWEGLLIKLGEIQDGIATDALRLLADVLMALPEKIDFVNEKWQELKQFINENSESINSFVETVSEGLQLVVETVSLIIETIIQLVTTFFESNREYIINALDAIMTIVESILNVIQGIVKVILGLIQGDWETVWEGIKQATKGIWEGIKGIIELGLNIIKGLINTALNAIKGIFQVIWNAIKAIVEGVWNGIKAVVKAGINFVKSIVESVLNVIKGIWESIWGVIGDYVKFVWELIKAIVEGAILFVKSIIQAGLNIIKAIWEAIWGSIKDTATKIWDDIKITIQQKIEFIFVVIEKVTARIKDTWTKVWNAIKDFIKPIWDAIKSTVQNTIDAIKSVIEKVMNAIKSVWERVWNDIKDFTKPIWDAIKNTVENVINTIKGIIERVTNTIKSIWERVWNSIKTTTQTIWNGIKSVIENVLNPIKNFIQNTMNTIKGIVQNIWNSIKSTTQNVWNSIKSTITNIVNGIKNTVQNVFNSIKNIAQNVWKNVKEAMIRPVEQAGDKIKGILDRIKGFFSSLKLKLPKIEMPPLPHFSLDGEFSLKPPSVPRLSVDWYKEGGILTEPTIFGASGGKLLGGGEAGAEAVLPIEKLGGIMADTLNRLGYGKDDKPTEIVQNLTINSPKHLSPAETARRNKRELQKLALEL